MDSRPSCRFTLNNFNAKKNAMELILVQDAGMEIVVKD